MIRDKEQEQFERHLEEMQHHPRSRHLQILGAIQRAAHTQLNRALRAQQPFFDRAAEGRAVGVFMPAEVAIPHIAVRIELHQRQRFTGRRRSPA